MDGLSLANDEKVRAMWAGLFAKALEPDSGVIAERPFFSVLQSLSPLDAKIIDLLAFITKTDSELKRSVEKFIPMDFTKITPKEKKKKEAVYKSSKELENKAILAIEDKAEEYGLKSISDPNWAENLMRLGVIERTALQHQNLGSIQVRSFDERAMLRGIMELTKQVEYMGLVAKRSSSAPETLFSTSAFNPRLRLELQLSIFGKRFAEACGLI